MSNNSQSPVPSPKSSVLTPQSLVLSPQSRIYVAGHRGLVGSALVRKLKAQGYNNLILRTSKELDLRRQKDVEVFFAQERPEYVFLAAARVGGILANNTYPADFIYDNIVIQTNVIHAAYIYGVKRFLFLGSSCIYPRECPQPMKEEHLLTGPLEPTNEPYAIAKIAGIKMCQSYNRQYGTNFVSVMPTNLYGPNDNFDLETSHVLPALIRKMHLGKCLQNGDLESIRKDLGKYPLHNCEVAKLDDGEIINLLSKFGIKAQYSKNSSVLSPQPSVLSPQPSVLSPQSSVLSPQSSVTIWGTGTPRREFLHVDDLADAGLFLMNLPDDQFSSLLSPQPSALSPQPSALSPQSSALSPQPSVLSPSSSVPPLINIGVGKDITIKELAELIKEVVGFKGELIFDTTRPDGTPRKLLDITKIKKLGWAPEIDLAEGIKQTYDWYKM